MKMMMKRRLKTIANNQVVLRKYLSIDDIHKEYLPISKKRIRRLVRNYLAVKIIGNRIFVSREELENLLSSQESSELDLGN